METENNTRILATISEKRSVSLVLIFIRGYSTLMK